MSLGGEVQTWAGVEVLTVVSDTSRVIPAKTPPVASHKTLQVEEDPCEAGGDQISIWLSLTARNIAAPDVAEVATTPQAPRTVIAEIAVGVSLVDVKR